MLVLMRSRGGGVYIRLGRKHSWVKKDCFFFGWMDMIGVHFCIVMGVLGYWVFRDTGYRV